MRRRKNNPRTVAFLNLFMGALIFVGVLIVLYPFVSDSLNHTINQRRLAYYQTRMDKKTVAKQKKYMERRNQELKKQRAIAVMDPFEDTTGKKKATSYTDHLIGSILIPKIKVDVPIYDQTNETYLEEGAALLDGTSFPLGGENTHAVISAHRGLPDKKFFTDLPDLQKGDLFILHVLDEKLAYKVERIRTVEPTDKTWLALEEGEDLVTLMTCTPYMVNSHRLLVTGKRVPYTAKMKEEAKEIKKKGKQQLFFYGSLVIVAVLLFSCFVYYQVKLRVRYSSYIH